MKPIFILAFAVALAGCSEKATLPLQVGADPALPQPAETLIPTINIAPASGWPEGAKPQGAPGTRVTAFASGLDHPRNLYVLPNGDVLVAESAAPERPDEGKGVKGRV